MKLQRTFIWIAGVFFVVGFTASQAAAGTGTPGCSSGGIAGMEIEVNARRAGGKTVNAGPNQTVNVTSKARILKGTAFSDTTIVTVLTIDAEDSTGIMDTQSSAPITLSVGKGGKGAKLTVNVPRCDGGFISFHASFFGTDEDGDGCEGTRTLNKACK